MRLFLSGISLSLLLCAGCGCSLGSAHAAPAKPIAPPQPAVSKDAGEDLQISRFEALRRFGQVLDIVEHSYVKEVNQGDLINGALRGMLQGLDPHSTFMSAEEYKDMQETTSGEFFGIGIEISMENGQVVVVTPIEDTPAFKAGMKSGDIILTINGQPTQELTLQDVVSKIRGPKGTEVEISVLHSDSKKPSTLRIVRDAIPLVSVKSRMLEPGYHWIRLTRFGDKTTAELRDALKEAEKASRDAGGIKGIILDLRNNPGGLLNQAVTVSDIFLSKGHIVSMKGRDGMNEKFFNATSSKDDVHAPLVVLVNSGSASASEIVAGALRDQQRAVTVGERSFGKGSVQNIVPLADGSALKLTIALYYTPSGSSIQAEGIVPDIEVPFEAPRTDKEDGITVREADLNRHLENKNADKGGKSSAKASEDAAKFLEKDNQLRMALQIVKGLPKMQAIKN